MLKQSLISSDETDIDFQKEWKETIFYRIFKIKNPLKGWKSGNPMRLPLQNLWNLEYLKSHDISFVKPLKAWNC